MLRQLLFFALAPFVVACSGGGNGSSGSPGTTSPPVNTGPSVTSAANLTINENTLGLIYTLTANDSDGTVATLRLLNTGDAGTFQFDAASGELSLLASLDFDNPDDSNGDNVYDLQFEVVDDDGASVQSNLSITLIEATLNANNPPSDNFELEDWKLQIPVDSNGNFSGSDSDQIDEWDLSDGHESAFFFTGADGGMVLRAPPQGATTSANTVYTRTELREMLRRGNTSISTNGSGNRPNGNNWALSSQPSSAQADAVGIDGKLRVTMAVNSVTETGENFQIGRLIIGQIHAASDEPIRLYYRKLPGNSRGTIYAAHEISGGDDVWYDIIGGRSDNEPDPVNGIALDEVFTYEIEATGNLLTVSIFNNSGTRIGLTDIDMSSSGYDVENDYMYFKAGVYHVNNSADADEWVQVTIYELENSHLNYPF